MGDFTKRYLEFCKPFVDALHEVYETMLGTKIRISACGIKDNNAPMGGDYSAIMGINGVYVQGDVKLNFKGSLIISWPEQTYLNSAEKMLGEKYTSFCDDIADLGMEICNITMGKAKSILNPIGYKIEMSIPTSIHSKEHSVRSEKGVVSILSKVDSEIGPFYLELNYKDIG